MWYCCAKVILFVTYIKKFKMEDTKATSQKRLSTDESNAKRRPNEISSNLSQKPVVVDKAYEGIRGHECHILFHFFTVFGISFLIGVMLIHLSLWRNSHLNISNQTFVPSHPVSRDTDHINDMKEVNASSVNFVNDVSNIWAILKPTLYYTGNYFHEQSQNVSERVLHT